MGHCVHRVTQFQRNKVEPLKTCFIRALNGLAHVFCLHRRGVHIIEVGFRNQEKSIF